MTQDWKERAAEKKASVERLIPKEWRLPESLLLAYNENSKKSVLEVPRQFMEAKEIRITENYDCTELTNELAKGGLTAVEVAKAFMHRAAIASQLTNCTTEILFEFGIERAKFLDEYLRTKGKPLGPLHGLPISIKDSFNVPGFDSTLGVIAYIGNGRGKSMKESDMVKTLLDLGAVLYVKTNIPLSLMTADSENQIFGRTLNPNNLSLTAGGSSGGEGSLIRQRGALVGIGSDIAGSIRIPALCNGIYGLKPTFGRLPISNQMIGGRENLVSLKPNIGPLASSFEGMEVLMKAVIDSKPWEKYYDCLYLRWRPYEITEKPIKVGVLFGDPKLPVYAPVERNLREACEKIATKGHEIIEVKEFPSFEQCWTKCLQNYMLDPEGEEMANFLQSTGQPIIRSMTQQGLEYFKPDTPKNMNSLIEMKIEMNNTFIKKWFSIFKDNNLDVLICPGNCSTAPPHDTYGIPPYTAMWNLVDYPACIIPFGKIDIEKDPVENAQRRPHGMANFYADYDDPKKYEGGIGHIQLVTKPYMEEKLLAIGKAIDNILNK